MKDNFFIEWKEQIEEIKLFLDFLNNEKSEYTELMGMKSLLRPEELIENQKGWNRLVSKYNGPEASFFKPTLVPIDRLSFEYFIDISDPNFPIIKYSYFQDYVNRYFRQTYIQSILFFKELVHIFQTEIIKHLNKHCDDKQGNIIYIIYEAYLEITKGKKKDENNSFKLSKAEIIQLNLNIDVQYEDEDFITP